MDVEAQLRLSFYKEVAIINPKHNVTLVQHQETGKLFVKKELSVYDVNVFRHLMECPVPGIPRIEELVETDGKLYVFEEYISGVTLQELLGESMILKNEQAVSYIQQLCCILRPLHNQNPPIVHRDIKPSNIIITSLDRVYLVDINSAKKVTAKGQDTVLIGTVGYAAPEQYGFSSSQPTADIYALGVLLNEMLTGGKISDRLTTGPLARVINRCVQMEPASRYQNVDQLLMDLPQNQQDSKHRIRKSLVDYLPPGFRSRKPWHWMAALLWYCMAASLSASLIVDEVNSTQLLIYRVGIFCLLIVETLWFGNYLNVWDYFPLVKEKNQLLRILGLVSWSICFFFAIILLMVMIVTIP